MIRCIGICGIYGGEEGSELRGSEEVFWLLAPGTLGL